MDGLSVKKKEYMPLRKSAAYNHKNYRMRTLM